MMKNLLKQLLLAAIIICVSYSVSLAESSFYNTAPMGYFYYNKAESDYQAGRYQDAIDNYVMASKGFHEEGNLEMQSRAYDRIGKSRLHIQLNEIKGGTAKK